MDNVWGQYKLEARKLPENGNESHLSSARFVGCVLILKLLFACVADISFMGWKLARYISG